MNLQRIPILEQIKNEARTREILTSCGAIHINEHFVYTSGLHGSAFIDKAAIVPNPLLFDELAAFIAAETRHMLPEVVLGAAVVGAMLAMPVGRHLHTQINHPACSPRVIFADKEIYHPRDEHGNLFFDNSGEPRIEERLVIKRGYSPMLRGKAVLIVEDIINTGKTVHTLMNLARNAGARVIGIAALCNRGPCTAADFGGEPLVLTSLVQLKMDVYDPKIGVCPLCHAGIPINEELGHGKEYMEHRRRVA